MRKYPKHPPVPEAVTDEDSLIEDNSLHELEEITGVNAPDPEKSHDPWYHDPKMNIYYDETDDNK
jgi:hypothetical protein